MSVNIKPAICYGHGVGGRKVGRGGLGDRWSKTPRKGKGRKR